MEVHQQVDFLIQVTMVILFYQKKAMIWFCITIMLYLKKEITVYGLKRIGIGTWAIATI